MHYGHFSGLAQMPTNLNRCEDSGCQEALDFVNKPADLVFAGEIVNADAYAGGPLHCAYENLPGFKELHEVFRRYAFH